MEAAEMQCLRNICGVRRLDRKRKEEIQRRCSKEVSVNRRGFVMWKGWSKDWSKEYIS